MNLQTEKILLSLGIEKLQEQMQTRFPNTKVDVALNPNFWVLNKNLKAVEALDKQI